MLPFPETPPLLTRAEHLQMLRDIAQVSLAVAARADTARAWDDLDVVPGSGDTPPCPRERLSFISQSLPALAQDCTQIARAPLTDLRAETRQTAPPDRARHVSTAALLRAVRGGHAARWVEETFAQPTHDTPETRRVKWFLGHLRRDADAIAALADAAGLPDVSAQARTAATRLQTLRAQPFWETITDNPGAWITHPATRMQRHPAFARIDARMRDYRRAFALDWDHPLFSLPTREQWQLYEAWGVFQTVRALLFLGAAPCPGTIGQPGGLLSTRQTLLALRLATGEQSRLDLQWPDGKTLSLYFQRPFAAGQRSLSRTLQPDICLEDAHGAAFLLDPKYKAYTAPGDEGSDMDQMHAYRDAIVGPDGGRIVRRAWCLYAGGMDTQARPMISYGPPAESIVGALHLRPGDEAGFNRLCSLLRAWLGV